VAQWCCLWYWTGKGVDAGGSGFRVVMGSFVGVSGAQSHQRCGSVCADVWLNHGAIVFGSWTAGCRAMESLWRVSCDNRTACMAHGRVFGVCEYVVV
jgi:hypothetical protein